MKTADDGRRGLAPVGATRGARLSEAAARPRARRAGQDRLGDPHGVLPGGPLHRELPDRLRRRGRGPPRSHPRRRPAGRKRTLRADADDDRSLCRAWCCEAAELRLARLVAGRLPQRPEASGRSAILPSAGARWAPICFHADDTEERRRARRRRRTATAGPSSRPARSAPSPATGSRRPRQSGLGARRPDPRRHLPRRRVARRSRSPAARTSASTSRSPRCRRTRRTWSRPQKGSTSRSPNEPAIALVIGYDHAPASRRTGRRCSDTLMLIRADPHDEDDLAALVPARPRRADLLQPGAAAVTTDRINSAYSRCGRRARSLTVKKLTGLPINYLITVNFHGFKEVVDKLGGVWMDVDRRYYNQNTGSAYDNYANINLQPGYQRLNGQQALDFVRFRHTDSDLYRVARQQEFVARVQASRSRANFSPFTRARASSNAITQQHRGRARAGASCSGEQVLKLRALRLRAAGRARVPGEDRRTSSAGYELPAPRPTTSRGGAEVPNPDVERRRPRTPPRSGRSSRRRRRRPSSVTVTVLNGNGVAGAAADASYLLGQRGYQTLLPPNNLRPNAPSPATSTRRSTTTRRRSGSKAAAVALQNLMQPADVAKLPRTPELLALDPGSMLLVVARPDVPRAIAAAPQQVVPKHQPAYVRFDASQAAPLLEPNVKKVAVPAADADRARAQLVPRHAARRQAGAPLLDRRQGTRRCASSSRPAANEYWGIEETDWTDAPVLADRSFRHGSAAASSTSTTPARTCTWSCCARARRDYWVVNTLLDSLSNETMLAIAKGLKPLTTGSRFARDGKAKIGIFGAGWVGLVTGACFAELGHEVVIRDVVPEKIDALARGEVPFHEEDVPELLERNAERLTFTLDVERRRRLRVPLRLRRHAADLLGRRRPLARLDGRRRAARADAAGRSSS